MTSDIDESARVVDSTTGEVEIREFVTIHDSEIGDGCKVYECSSIKKTHIQGPADINAGAYIENAAVGPNVQLGPNCSVVGVSHELSEEGMTFRDDLFERIILQEGSFVGANAVIGPGVEIGSNTVIAAGATVTSDIGDGKMVLGTPPAQRIIDLDDWIDY